jgi:hypothetical protein
MPCSSRTISVSELIPGSSMRPEVSGKDFTRRWRKKSPAATAARSRTPAVPTMRTVGRDRRLV